MTRSLFLVAVLTGILAGPALAEKQSYKMMLGNRQLGTLVFNGHGSNAALLSTMDHTPLGVANGTFEAVTRSKGGQVDYLGTSRGSKTREISFIRKGSTVEAVTVTPEDEKTDLSDTGKVPPGVISPTEVFASLANSGTCPSPMTMYDGRRVVKLATTGVQKEGNTVTCDMSYRVVMGPGHLSPFHFKSFGMQAVYSGQGLAAVTMSAGGFDVNLIRQ